MPRNVKVTMKAFKNICDFSSNYASNYIDRKKWVECMGYLFCRQDGEDYIISDAVGMSRGGETFVSMTPDDLAKIEVLEQEHPQDFLGGWWHTHPGLSPFYSDTDVQNQMFYQAQNEDGLGIVFDHSMIDNKFIGFKIFRLDDPQDPLTQYHEVKWEPLDWNEKELEESFKPIGVASKIKELLAFKLGLRNVPPQPELPPFRMPKVPNADTARKMIENTESSSEEAFEKGDKLQALMSKRVQISLMKELKENAEDLADEMLQFIEWTLEDDKYITAGEMLDQLDLMNDDQRFPGDIMNYYLAKAAYLRGITFKKQFRYSNAIENFEKSMPFFEEEEIYDEECANASEHIASCYERQKEYKKALEWTEKAIKYAQEALKFAEENIEDEEDEEDIAYLKEYQQNLENYKKRLSIMISAQSTGPQRIV